MFTHASLTPYLWLIAAFPLLAAGLISVCKQHQKRFAATASIGALGLSLLLSCGAFVQVLRAPAGASREVFNFRWLQFGESWVSLGWVLDPLTAIMLVIVSFVGLLIFIFSVGYMEHDPNFTRFFCFLSLFAAAMLGLVISNSLLLLFICWELVGLTSYLLIGFWYFKPAAAAAARKAFITTRLGDLAFLLGIVLLYSRAGTLMFYDSGKGCLEADALSFLSSHVSRVGITMLALSALLIFCGAIGKSGQVPLHVWLPDAMEGPTPVSALIHAATMVAAGVFLVARTYPLFAGATGFEATNTLHLHVVTWIGAITAVFAATIAVAQTDIKRILAYSTVSQLGFMMLGLGLGGVAVGMFHLITHAFFKALLFLGAGSVIHGCHEEQDVRRMGGLRKFMPVTFATYAIGMMALSGVPIFFSGFWSKDAILHSAHAAHFSHLPFYLCLIGALLTSFYMTRQVVFVFFGECRLHLGKTTSSEQHTLEEGDQNAGAAHTAPMPAAHSALPHESPAVMTLPLIILAVCSVLLGFFGTPAWPWFQGFLTGTPVEFSFKAFAEPGLIPILLVSSAVALGGIALGWWLYGRNKEACAEPDPVASFWPNLFTLWRRKYFVDEAYDWAVVGFTRKWARACDWLDRWVAEGGVQLVSYAVVGWSWIQKAIDDYVVNLGFDKTCRGLSESGGLVTRIQNGRVQRYLRVIGIAVAIAIVLLIWGCRAR